MNFAITSSNKLVQVTREIQCDIGHRIPFHKAACSNVHGHRYRIVVTVEGEVLEQKCDSDEGMVMDFGDLKSIMMKEIHDVVDHAFMVWKDDQPLRSFLESQNFQLIVTEQPPTAEYFAAWCFERMKSACIEHFDERVTIHSVTIWETPNCSATFSAYQPSV